MLLAIDTASAWSGLALYDADGLHAEARWRSGRQHTEQLLAQLDLLMAHLALTPADLTALAVALGPGSWAGLRAGLSLAKSIAVAHDLPLLGVASMEALAWPERQRDEPVITVVQLGRSRYAISEFAPLAQPCAAAQIAVCALDEVPLRAAVYVGDLDAALVAHLAAAHGPTTGERTRRPAALAEIAWLRWQAGEQDDLVKS